MEQWWTDLFLENDTCADMEDKGSIGVLEELLSRYRVWLSLRVGLETQAGMRP
jgi:hypothetical protein